MIREFVEAWDANKNVLEEHFKTHDMEQYSEYSTLVRLLFNLVINPYLTDNGQTVFALDIAGVDDGDYQGTQLFILHRDTYQPDISDYVVTHQYYGSCSGCDTLMAIHDCTEGLPSEHQLKEYMMLCLHLLQRCKYLYTEEEHSNEIINECNE